MKDKCRNFSLSKWQDTREPWLILIIVTIGLTCIALSQEFYMLCKDLILYPHKQDF